MKRNNIAIQLSCVTKQYTIHHEKPTLVEKIVKNREEKFFALNCITLTIKKGERVGIIGPNGSGKTTLLKIIAGITTPTSGTVKTEGRIISLIDLEAGFHPDLTGIQNIYLNGMLLGMRKYHISKMINNIIKFADIKQFIDTPLYTYSEGMKLRLGFAIAVYNNPHILLLDEDFAVGDQKFQKNAQIIINRYIKNYKTIVLASHWLQLLKTYCNRILILEKGKLIGDGPISILNKYQRYPQL